MCARRLKLNASPPSQVSTSSLIDCPNEPLNLFGLPACSQILMSMSRTPGAFKVPQSLQPPRRLQRKKC
eukprot:scaffold625024_cov34-Prasinocladus_malaysianus.AAC.1